VARLWWLRLPVAVGRVSVSAAVALIDGFYAVAWPWAAIVASPFALALGVYAGWHTLGYTHVFSESMALMMLAAVLGTLGGHFGFLFVAGFAIGDFLLARPEWGCPFGSGSVACGDMVVLNHLLRVRIPLLISYGLMAWLAFKIPVVTKALLAELPLSGRLGPRSRFIVGIIGHAAMTVLLAYFWTQTVPILIRPVFTWRNWDIPPDAVIPIQVHGSMVVAAALAASIARMLLQGAVVFHPERGRRVDWLRARLSSHTNDRPVLAVLDPWVGTALAATWSTLLLAGTFESWAEAIILGVLVLILQAAHRRLIPVPLGPWPRLLDRLPVILRVLAAVIVAHVVSRRVLEAALTSTSNSFRPVVMVVGIGLIVFFLLNPGPSKDRVRRTAQ
jgi:hypothetical protein